MLATTLRPAEAKDAEAISHLLAQLGYATTPAQLKPVLAQQQVSTQDIIVAILDKKVVGVMSLIYFDYLPSVEKYCRITTLVVDQALRGWGMGKELIQYAKQQALAHQCQVLELTTGLQRTEAHAFYEHLGFEQVSYKYTQRLVKPA